MTTRRRPFTSSSSESPARADTRNRSGSAPSGTAMLVLAYDRVRLERSGGRVDVERPVGVEEHEEDRLSMQVPDLEHVEVAGQALAARKADRAVDDDPSGDAVRSAEHPDAVRRVREVAPALDGRLQLRPRRARTVQPAQPRSFRKAE